MYQQLWGYKVEEELYLGVREQKRLNTTAIDLPIPVAGGLRRRSAAPWLLGSWDRIPLGALMFVSCVYMLCCPV
jgi:hypothetical protein